MKLSPNFSLIEKELKPENSFEIILSENRKNLLTKLFEFENSEDKIFYYILGSEGIGKSITFQYFSCISTQKILYLNLKLFTHLKTTKEIKDCFFKEIIKLFATNDNEIIPVNKTKIRIYLSKFKISNLSKNLYNYFWDLLYYFLNNIFDDDILPLIIILDQYKGEKTDLENSKLNEIIEKIVELNQSLQIKMIISSSLNNKEIKNSFVNNLKSISYNYKNDFENLINYKYNNNEIIIDEEEILFSNESDNEESENISIDNEIEKKEDKLVYNVLSEKTSNEEKNNETKSKENKFNSTLSLDNAFSSLTIKEYYNSIINCKPFISEIKEKYYQQCIKLFNYSMKYYYKFLTFNETLCKNSKGKEKGENEQLNIVNNFLFSNFQHFQKKILEFYEKDYNFLENLIELRRIIFIKKKFKIKEFSELAEKYPLKYLKIIINGKNNFQYNITEMDCKFRFEFMNNFIRHSINKIISDKKKEIFGSNSNDFSGSVKGNFLEKEVIEKFNKYLKQTLGIEKIEKKYLFSLVGTKKHSKTSVEKKRKNEKILEKIFYDEQQFNCIIDDIDINEKHNLKENTNYLLIQLSETGEDFDFSFLFLKDNKYYLINFQVTKNKSTTKIKSSEKYIESGEKIKNHIQNLYNIKVNNSINKFIIPYNEDKTKNNLIKSNISFLLYNENDFNFYIDKNIKLQLNDITYNDNEIIYDEKMDIENLELSLEIISMSEKSFLKKKRNFNQILQKNIEKCIPKRKRIKLILNDEMKNKIKEIFKKKLQNKKQIYYFSLINIFFGKNIFVIRNKNIMIIFSLNEKLYFLWDDDFYCSDEEINHNNQNKIISKLFNYSVKIKNVKFEKINSITINEINKYEGICFCFKVYFG